MGAVIAVDIAHLPDAILRGERRIRRAIGRGALAGAHRGRAFMVPRTPTDLGELRASWRVKPGVTEFVGPESTLATLINDAPTVAWVELGTRPHKVSAEGWASIYEWVRRHYRGGRLGGAGRMRPRRSLFVGLAAFRGDDPTIERITNAIVRKINREGSKPTLFIANSLDELRAVMAAELNRAIARAEAQARSDTNRGGAS